MNNGPDQARLQGAAGAARIIRPSQLTARERGGGVLSCFDGSDLGEAGGEGAGEEADSGVKVEGELAAAARRAGGSTILLSSCDRRDGVPDGDARVALLKALLGDQREPG